MKIITRCKKTARGLLIQDRLRPNHVIRTPKMRQGGDGITSSIGISTNATAQVLYSNTESATGTGISLSIS